MLVSLLGTYSRRYDYCLSTTINPIRRYIDMYLVAERYSVPTSYPYKQLPRVDLAETPQLEPQLLDERYIDYVQI